MISPLKIIKEDKASLRPIGRQTPNIQNLGLEGKRVQEGQDTSRHVVIFPMINDGKGDEKAENSENAWKAL